jgi:hypothetical protein
MKTFSMCKDTAVMTTAYVTQDGMPVLTVSHEYDDENRAQLWHFHAGNEDFSPDKLQLVRLATILALDPTLSELADLPLGFSATRSAPGEPWLYQEDEQVCDADF